MLLALLVAIAAAAVARARGGSLERLAETQFAALPLLFGSLVIQIAADIWAPDWLAGGPGLAVVMATNLGVAGFLALNRRLPGMLLAAMGLLLNLVVITANGAMPVSESAADLAGVESLAEMGVKHEIAGPETALPWLGDVIPVPLITKVWSLGDVVLAAGIGLLVYRRTSGSHVGDAGDEESTPQLKRGEVSG